MSFSAVNL